MYNKKSKIHYQPDDAYAPITSGNTISHNTNGVKESQDIPKYDIFTSTIHLCAVTETSSARSGSSKLLKQYIFFIY